MKKGLVTAIITTYQRELSLLREAVDSVLSQTYRNIELIVVDDNGIGDPCQIRNQELFSGMKQVKYIANPRNAGAQVSRNTGILFSEGEFVAFLDDDDVWMPEKIEKQMALLTDGVGMVFCDGYEIRGTDRTPLKSYQNPDSFLMDITYEDMLYDDYIGTTTQALIRKECFAVSGLFDERMPARQDYEMWIRISRYFPVRGVNEKLFLRRIHDGTQISRSYEKAFEGYRLILEKYRMDYKKHSKAKAKKILKLCIMSIFMKHYFRAVYYLLWSFMVSPATTVGTMIHTQVLRKGSGQ